MLDGFKNNGNPDIVSLFKGGRKFNGLAV